MGKDVSNPDISVVKERLTTLRRDGIENLDSFLKELQNFVFSATYIRVPEDFERQLDSLAQKNGRTKGEAAIYLMKAGYKHEKDKKGKGEKDEDDEEEHWDF